MCAVCAVIGVLLFGDRTAPAFGGYLNAWTELQDLPELTLYSMLWWPLVMLIWQFMALWWQVPVVPYLGFGNELANVLMLTCKTLTCSLCCPVMYAAIQSNQSCVACQIVHLLSGLAMTCFLLECASGMALSVLCSFCNGWHCAGVPWMEVHQLGCTHH